jgi:hypothetical protein
VERRLASFGELDCIHRDQRPQSVVFDPIFSPSIG